MIHSRSPIELGRAEQARDERGIDPRGFDVPYMR